MKKRTGFPLVLVSTIIAMNLLACSQKEDSSSDIAVVQEEEESNKFNSARVKKGTVTQEVEISCTYQPKQKIELGFSGESKKIKEILVEKGDAVTKGQVLARLENDAVDELIEDAKYQIEMCELQVEQEKELQAVDLAYLDQEYHFQDEDTRDGGLYDQNKKKIIKDYTRTIEDLTDQITVNQMRLSEYQKTISEGTIIAVDDGVIVNSQSNLIGSYAKPSQTVITMIRNGDLTFVSTEIEKEKYIEKGQKYTVYVGKGENQTPIDVTASDVDHDKGEMYFEIEFANIKMDSGTHGTIWVTLDQKDNVLYVPNEAVHKNGEKEYVYTVSDDGMRKIQYVTIGITGRENTEIVEGLTTDQYVVVD